MEITITKSAALKEKPPVKGLPFGKVFTDHMFLMNYTDGIGWHDARVVPYGPLEFDLGTVVFHYGQEMFEGMKAYRTAEGKIQMFRPMENIRRMNRSAARMGLPELPEEDTLQALHELVKLEADWVPHGEGTSMYIRPFMIGDDEQLGVHGIGRAHFIIILSPSGSYYSGGMAPVKIMIEDEDVRAVRGGTGEAKCGGNYAASVRAGDRAEEKGYTQVLWLDGVDRKYIEEVGAMIIMFKIAGKIVTPALNGSILPGITRKSILEMCAHLGLDAEERRISVDELVEAMENGTLEEAWGCGTAAVVSPVGTLAYAGKEYTINNNQIGETTMKLYEELTGLQWGKKPDPFGWVYPVK